MRSLASWVFAFAAANLSGLADAGGGFQGKTTSLSVNTFDDYLTGQRFKKRGCLIMFHVSWCKVCQRSFPEFAQASVTMDSAQPDKGVDFAHVDCEADKPLCQRYAVKGYPTIKLFSADESIEPRNYRGIKKEHGFVKFIERMTKDPVMRLVNRDDLAEASFNETFASFVAAVPAEADVPVGLSQTANEWMDRHRFGAASSLASVLAEGVKVPDGATLAAIAHSEQQWGGLGGKASAPAALAFYTGSLEDAGALSAWVEASRFPGVWHLQEANFFEFTHANRSAVMVAVDFSEKLEKSTEDAVRSAAAALHESFLFGVINGADFVDELANFGLKREDLPRVLVTESNFENWIEDIEELRASHLKGDLQALLDGAPILRQGRTTWSKIEYYRREFTRKTKQAQDYAKQGPKESAIVFAACMGGSFVLWLCWKFLCMVLGALLAEPDFPEYPIKRD